MITSKNEKIYNSLDFWLTAHQRFSINAIPPMKIEIATVINESQ